jgi:signal transduction histidine kinase
MSSGQERISGSAASRSHRSSRGWTRFRQEVFIVFSMDARSRGEAVDWAVAVMLALAMAAAAGLSAPAQPAVRAVAVLSATGLLALAVRRRRPLAALAAVLAVVLIETITASQSVAAPSFLAMMAATYSVGAHASARAAAAGLPAAVIGVAAAQVLSPQMAHYSHADSIAFFTVILVIAPVTAGAVVRARAGLAGRLRQATRRLQDARADTAAWAVARERQRIVTELEAVMLRGLDGMRRHVAARDREEVAELERIARGTLAAMRGLLARFRPGDDVADGSGARRDGTDHARDRMPASLLPELRARVAAALVAETTEAAQPAPLPSRWTLPSARQVDAALTLAAFVLTAALLATRRWPVDALLAAGTAIPIAWLRRAPLPAAAVCLVATLAYSAIARPADPLAGLTPTFLLAVPLVTGAACALRQAVGVLIACLLCVFLCVVLDPGAQFGQVGAIPAAALVLACWAVGRLLGDGGRMLTALAEAAASVRDENAATARRAVAGERLRIARELHDAVGHALTTIVMQATAARRVWDSDPPLAGQHVATLRAITAQTASELHELVLSVAVGAGDAPAGLGGIRALATRASVCGLPVELHADGAETQLPPDAARAAYRIVQEAITNAARHAPGASIQVRALYNPEGLALEISNDPSAWLAHQDNDAADGGQQAARQAAENTRTGGHGLRGMHERATNCGGIVSAGSRPDGGFTVRAYIPCPAVPAAANSG